jgi:PAS domain S-box-containing protein
LTPSGGWPISSLEALPSQRLSQLQAIYDGAPVGLCFLDCNLRYVSINQRLADMNGKPVTSYMGRSVKEMVPASYSALEPFLLRALRGESFSEIEGPRPPKNPGEAPWTALLSYQPALDEANEVIGISVAVIDITEHKRTIEALARLAVFDAMPVGTVIASSDLQHDEQWKQ